MPRSTTWTTVGLAAGQFALIVVGVMVALAGDNWVQEREEADRAEAALALLADDLRADSERLARLAPFPLRHDSLRAIVWSTPPDAQISQDSVLVLFRRLILAQPYEPPRAAYESLLASDGLRYIPDEALRGEIVRYYEESQAQLVLWYDLWSQLNLDFFKLTRFVQTPAPTSIDEGLEGWLRVPKRLVREWPAIRRDDELMGQLWLVSIYSRLYGDQLDRVVEANQDLQGRLSEWLQ